MTQLSIINTHNTTHNTQVNTVNTYALAGTVWSLKNNVCQPHKRNPRHGHCPQNTAVKSRRVCVVDAGRRTEPHVVYVLTTWLLYGDCPPCVLYPSLHLFSYPSPLFPSPFFPSSPLSSPFEPLKHIMTSINPPPNPELSQRF